MRKTLILAVCFALTLVSTTSEAILFEIDPGNVGDSAGVVSLTSSDIIGLPADGRTVEWHFVFSDMKYVELTNPFSAGGKSSVANLLLDFGADFCTDCVPYQRPIAGTQIMYLTDEHGDPIPGTGVLDAGVSVGSDTAQYNIFAAGDQNNPTLTFYDLYFNITLPVVTNGDGALPIITSANLSLGRALDSTIGQSAPVPEPSTILLLGSSLAGLAGFGRKKFFKK